MNVFLNLIALTIAAVYFVGVGGLLIFGFFDRQKDSLIENRVIAVFLFIALIVMPAFGIIYSLR
jgi:hypothetical protein